MTQEERMAGEKGEADGVRDRESAGRNAHRGTNITQNEKWFSRN
jgi:hypothetical protein